MSLAVKDLDQNGSDSDFLNKRGGKSAVKEGRHKAG